MGGLLNTILHVFKKFPDCSGLKLYFFKKKKRKRFSSHKGFFEKQAYAQLALWLAHDAHPIHQHRCLLKLPKDQMVSKHDYSLLFASRPIVYLSIFCKHRLKKNIYNLINVGLNIG